MGMRALALAAEIKGGLAGSVMAALTLASLGSTVFAIPAAAARAPAESVTDSIRSGPYGSRHVSQAPAAGAPTAKPTVAPRIPSNCDSTFHQVSSVNPGSAYNVISNLAAISSTDMWAVGAFGNTHSGPDQTLAMRWNGSAWSHVVTPDLGPGNDDLWGVTTVPGATVDMNNVWTVGDYTDSLKVEHPQAFRFNTLTAWAQFTPANYGNGNNLLIGATAIGANNVWAVGSWRQSNGNPSTVPPTPPSPARTLIGHWDGTTFDRPGP
jgi:hypothetical protein